MLDTDRREALGIEFKRLPVAPEGAHAHRRCAPDLVVNARQRQAAFLYAVLPVAAEDLRVDEYLRLVMAGTDIDNQQPFVHVDLSRRKPDAFGRIHGLDHVIGQLPQCIIDLDDGLGLGAQARVRILENY